MKCLKCGFDNEANAKFCKECGVSLLDVANKDDNRFATIKKVVKSKIFITVLSISLLAYAGVIIYRNATPVNRFVYLVVNQKTDKATEVYKNKIKDNDELNNKAKKVLEEKLDTIYNSYCEKDISFEKAIEKANIYKGYPLVKDKQQEVVTKLNNLNSSRKAYNKAVKAEKDKNINDAIKSYGNVIEEDDNYATATKKLEQLKTSYILEKKNEAEGYITNKQYTEAINCIENLIGVIGEEQELVELKEQYQTMKNEQYVKISFDEKVNIEKDYDAWRFNDIVAFTLFATNNTEKSIRGIEGTATFFDIFGKEIISMGCDITGCNIAPGESYGTVMSFEINPYMDDHVKLYGTEYKDLKFEYTISTIVFDDGTSIQPE